MKSASNIGVEAMLRRICLDEPGANSRIPEGASKVPHRLGVVVGAFPTGSVTACNRQPSESDAVHDHIRLGQHQILAIARIVVHIRARHMKHTNTIKGGQTVGGSSCSGELSPGRRLAEMISDRCSDADRKVFINRFRKELLPTAQALALAAPIDHQPAKREPRRLLSNSTLIADNLGWKATRSDAHQIIRDAWNTFEPRTALAT